MKGVPFWTPIDIQLDPLFDGPEPRVPLQPAMDGP